MKSDFLNNLSALPLDSKVLQAGICVAYLQALRKLAVVHAGKDPETVSFVAQHAPADEKEHAGTRPVMVEMPLDSLIAFPAVPAAVMNVPVPGLSGKADFQQAGLPG